MIDGIWILFVCFAATLVLAWLGLGGAGAGRRRHMKARVQRAIGKRRPGAEPEAASIKRRTNGGSPVLDALARRLLPDPDAINRRLERTGRSISLGAYAAAHLGIAAVAVVFLHFGAGFSWPVAALAAAGIAVALPHMAVGRMGRRRIGRFEALFPDAIDLMVRGLRSGLPVSETIAAVGREMKGPVGEEFRRVADAVRLGRDQDDALWDAARRLDTAEFKFFVISLSIQKETGGNLSETLANLSDILRRRRQMRLKVRAMSSEARASAYILGSLPFAMFVIIYMLNPDYEQQLFTDPRGKMMLAAAGGLMSTGIAVMAKMVRFEI